MMFSVMSLEQIATDHWKASAHQTISFAYRASESVQKSSRRTGLAHKIWRIANSFRRVVDSIYESMENPPPPTGESFDRDTVEGLVRTLNELYESAEKVYLTIKQAGQMNNSQIAAPVQVLLKQAEEILGFANWIQDLLSEETDSLFQQASDDYRRGKTLSFEEALQLGASP